jgi:hypothetical protein
MDALVTGCAESPEVSAAAAAARSIRNKC